MYNFESVIDIALEKTTDETSHTSIRGQAILTAQSSCDIILTLQAVNVQSPSGQVSVFMNQLVVHSLIRCCVFLFKLSRVLQSRPHSWTHLRFASHTKMVASKDSAPMRMIRNGLRTSSGRLCPYSRTRRQVHLEMHLSWKCVIFVHIFILEAFSISQL